MSVQLPDELAPALRARAEALLAELRPARPIRPDDQPVTGGRKPCYVCGVRRGPMGGHHLIPGDNSSVVPVHHGCHRRLHRKAKAPSMAGC